MSGKINWYPGHMAKARRKIEEKLDMVDMVLEMRDARIPAASGNPSLEEILEEQELMIVLNKRDLADRRETERWLDNLSSDHPAAAVNSLKGRGTEEIISHLKQTLKKIRERRESRKAAVTGVRAMVVGVPNCGKSTLINSLSRRSGTKTGSNPGVTRGQQWINISDGIRIMDTPGLLWPDIEERERGLKLAMCGSVRSEVVDTELLACRILDYLRRLNPAGIEKRDDVEIIEDEHSYDLLAEIGRRRGCLESGGRVDRTRAGRIVIGEFQEGKLGRVTLEKVEEYTNDR